MTKREIDTEQKQQSRSEGRRKLLKKAGVSSGAVAAASLLPDNWVKPILNSVALPAHAETSIGNDGGGVGGVTTVAATTVAGTTVAATTVAGTTVAGTTVAPTTTLPPCSVVSAILTDSAMIAYTAPGAAVGITQAMTAPEFNMVSVTTENCPDGTEVEFVLDIDNDVNMSPSTETLTAVTAGDVAIFNPLTDAGMNAMGTGTFSILSSTAPIGGAPIVITLDWTAP